MHILENKSSLPLPLQEGGGIPADDILGGKYEKGAEKKKRKM
jgi:hypothetical protein